MTSLSALIMASNEESMLPGCLSLLAWADEVVVIVDDRSNDRTAEIAAELGARVNVEPWHGFAGQRDRLAELSTGDWLLYIDADERVTVSLANEIRLTLERGQHEAYSVPTRNVFLGRPMYAGGWWPDRHYRLIRRDSLIGWQGAIHEVPLIRGGLGSLRNPIVHLGHRDLTSMLAKTAAWSRLDGQRLAEGRDKPIRLRTMLRAIERDVRQRLVRNAGWRDGIEGWIEVLYQAFSSFITVAQAWESQRRDQVADKYRRLDLHLQNGGSIDDFPKTP